MWLKKQGRYVRSGLNWLVDKLWHPVQTAWRIWSGCERVRRATDVLWRCAKRRSPMDIIPQVVSYSINISKYLSHGTCPLKIISLFYLVTRKDKISKVKWKEVQLSYLEIWSFRKRKLIKMCSCLRVQNSITK